MSTDNRQQSTVFLINWSSINCFASDLCFLSDNIPVIFYNLPFAKNIFPLS